MIFSRKSTKYIPEPAAVLLDLDNTLYDYGLSHERAILAVSSKAQRALGVDATEFDRAFAEARSDVKSRLGNTASSNSRLLYFQRMIELLGMRTQVMLALDFRQTYWRTFLASCELFPGVKEFLEDMRLAEIPTAIVSDHKAHIQFRKIIYLGLEGYFDYVVTSEESGLDKPDSSIYDLALNKLDIGEGQVWMIGDHPLKDIKGAREAISACTFQKKHRGVELASGDDAADVVFEAFKELKEHYRHLLPKEVGN